MRHSPVRAPLFCALILCAGNTWAARDKVYSCNDAAGHPVFQDQPCGTALAPWERDLTDRTRWSNPVRTVGGCAVRSPSVSLSWLRVDTPMTFDGGVSLLLNADESGIAAAIVVQATWPADPLDPAQSSRRIELSGNISGQAIIPDAQAEFVVDSMDDPTRMRFGYRQTGNLLRALKRAATLKFHLTLRSPEVALVSESLELNGLDAALSALGRCAGQ
jgi:hypothetical protein